MPIVDLTHRLTATSCFVFQKQIKYYQGSVNPAHSISTQVNTGHICIKYSHNLLMHKALTKFFDYNSSFMNKIPISVASSDHAMDRNHHHHPAPLKVSEIFSSKLLWRLTNSRSALWVAMPSSTTTAEPLGVDTVTLSENFWELFFMPFNASFSWRLRGDCAGGCRKKWTRHRIHMEVQGDCEFRAVQKESSHRLLQKMAI